MPSDLELIDELHQKDMRASKDRDYCTLRSLMSEDAVVLSPGGRVFRGRDGLDKSFAAMSDALVTTDILDYRFAWDEVRVCGDFAFEWGSILSSERDRRTGVTISEMYNVMRILQRQANGVWKVHRTIWNVPTK